MQTDALRPGIRRIDRRLIGLVKPGLVGRKHFLRAPKRNEATLIEPQDPIAKRFDLIHRVGAKHNRAACCFQLQNALKRLAGKGAIAHGKRLINDQHRRLATNRNREGKPHKHAR